MNNQDILPTNIIEERLQFIFSNINDWIKFAEAKNGAMLAGNAVVIFAIFSWLTDCSKWHPLWIMVLSIISMVFLFISVVIGIISFFPHTRMSWRGKSIKPNEQDNLMFYGDIVKYEPKSFLYAIYKQEGIKPKATSHFEIDLAEQIVTNSGIADWKYQLFKIALWSTLSAVITPLLPVIFFLYKYVITRFKGNNHEYN